jgi:glyoxylase-like metal-dependent hydrolase (beta-lactamase superfamily II)
MKLIQHGPHLWQMTRFAFFNNYLVEETDGLTLVDTNMNGSQQMILEAAEAIGLPITRVTLTHAHGDHVGSLDEVARMLPEAEIAFAPRTAEFLQGNLDLRPEEPQTRLRGSFMARNTKATRLLVPGDKLGSLRVVAAPGHTPDQIAFWDERDGTLIAGDAFQTAAGTAVAGITRWLFPFPAMATWHVPTALETAVSLRQLNPNRLAVGHGPVLENPTGQMEQAIREAEAKVHGQTQTA